ncbi:MAG: PAS domain-containing protein [Rhodospirillaceae bacterium]|nr:PAS domain-containing protein [Rhodospirillaceae bacterium]
MNVSDGILRAANELKAEAAFDRAQARGMVGGLEALGDAAAILDGEGRIVEANGAFSRLPQALIRAVAGRLIAEDKKANDALQNAIRSALTIDPHSPEHIQVTGIPRQEGRPLVVWVSPIRPNERTGFSFVHALVVVRDLIAVQPPPAPALIKVFAMTPAEARLAQSLMNNRSLKDVAAELGISWESARTHLKVIFAKTGTRRQSELIGVLTKLPPPRQNDI